MYSVQYTYCKFKNSCGARSINSGSALFLKAHMKRAFLYLPGSSLLYGFSFWINMKNYYVLQATAVNIIATKF